MVSMRAILADHVADARAAVALVEVARNALLEVACLAHIEHAAIGIEIAVHAGQAWQGSHFGQELVSCRVARAGGGVGRSVLRVGHGRNCANDRQSPL